MAYENLFSVKRLVLPQWGEIYYRPPTHAEIKRVTEGSDDDADATLLNSLKNWLTDEQGKQAFTSEEDVSNLPLAFLQDAVKAIVGVDRAKVDAEKKD